MPEKKVPSKRSNTRARKAASNGKPGNALPPPAASPRSDEEIARKAYELWEHRGRPFGSPDEDWYKAQQELRTNGR